MPRVLITRDPERAQPLMVALAKRGLQSVAVPVTEVIHKHDRDLPSLSGFSWVVFTSANGVIALADELLRLHQELPEALHIGVVGDATADEVRRNFRAPDLIAASASAAGLAQDLIPHLKNEERGAILWPCAARTDGTFLDVLSQGRISVVSWVGYVNEAISPERLQEQLQLHAPWDVAFFAAPSAAAAFVRAWPLPWDFKTVAIGATTAEAFKEQGVSGTVNCLGATVDQQLDGILAAISLVRIRDKFVTPEKS